MNERDIAIIGMACRFPGAATPEEFWQNLRNGVESIRTLTDAELSAAGVPADSLADPSYVKACPVLEGVDQFDPAFFGLSPLDAAVMDPAHRIFLEVAWESLERAGYTADPAEGVVGVFAGSGAPYYLMDHVRRDANVMRTMGEFLARHTGNDMNFLTTRVSYELDLRGPSVNIQTACSTALVSVHMACESLRRGECTMAIAGGSTVLIPDKHGYHFREGEILSPDGHCRPFDARSSGTVFGSGAGCVILKPLTAALDDGDTIHAVIRGSAINNDGAQRAGYLAPGVEGQAAVVRRALESAGVSADTVSYIETHGTGTTVGDPIEVAALSEAFHDRTSRRQFCGIGSVKANIGHLGEAAGIASLIKAVLALKHRELPPTLGFASPSPHIDFANSPFFVNATLNAWHSDGVRRCGVTSLGAGGTNCHVILDEAPPALAGEGARPAQLVLLSARTPDALAERIERLAHTLEEDPSVDLADAAYTLAVGRRAMSHRTAIVAREPRDAVHALRAVPAASNGVDDGRALPVAFLFPGGGAQYPRMGAELYAADAVYRTAADECLGCLDEPTASVLRTVLFGSGAADSATLERPTYALPALFTTEYALARQLESWGVTASCYAGHSLGEYVAACLAGVFSLSDALRLVMRRAELFELVPPGRMLGVALGESDLRSRLPAGLDIAAVNAPQLCTVSGPTALVDAFAESLTAAGVDISRVRISVAAHSSMLDAILPEFRALCRTIQFATPRVPFTSNVTGRWATAAEATDPEYWVRHLRSTVRFAECLATLVTDGDRALLELGPGRALASLARAQGAPFAHVFTSMRHADDRVSDLETALGAVGQLWTHGADVDWHAFYDGQLRNRIPLPTYPWEHQRCWIDAAPTTMAPAPALAQPAARRAVSDWFARPSWRQAPPVLPLTSAPERVVVLCDDVGFGDAVARQFERTGRSVQRVYAGPVWTVNGDVITMSSSREDAERLLQGVARQGSPARIVHAWGVTAPDTPATLDHSLEHGFHSLLALGQAIAAHDADANITLDVLTNNMHRVGGEAWLDPAKALTLGPALTWPRELPGTRARTIDVVLPPSAAARDALALLVAGEIASPVTDEAIAYRGIDRFVRTLEHTDVTPVMQRLHERGVYVITGAFGGIGATIADHLARTYRARLVLLARNATNSAAQLQARQLESLGAEVMLVAASVSDASAVTAAFAAARKRFGQIHGVFHAAGVLDDNLMPFKSRADAERVLAPKVRGTLALDAAIGSDPLDLFVLFSSISSHAGLAGQADYTAANAFLDAFAAERNARGTFTVAVNWSAWRDVGMAARLAAEASGSSTSVVHPLLGRRIGSAAGESLFASMLSPDAHWTLGEHRLRNGMPLMPGTGMIEIAHAALSAGNGGAPITIRDASFRSAFSAPPGQATELRVRVSAEQSGNRSVMIGSRGSDGTWRVHATATGTHLAATEPQRIDIGAVQVRCSREVRSMAGTAHDAHMRFGPRWANIRSARFGDGEAVLALELPPEFTGDLGEFTLHPALLDMATGGAQAIVPGCDPRSDFYVPLAYGSITVFGRLPSRIYSHIRRVHTGLDATEHLAFDVTIADESGRVLVDIREFMMTRVTDVTRMFRADIAAQPRDAVSFDALPASTARFIQRLDDAITCDEGVQAIECIVNGPAVPQLFVTPRPVQEVIAELRTPPVVTAPAEAVTHAATVLPDIAETLAEHVAVRQCTVVERMKRDGRAAAVAYFLRHDHAQVTVSELRRFLRAALPTDRVPAAFIEVESIPRTKTGAIDTEALPDPFAPRHESVPPRTDMEKLVAAIWMEVLGVDRISTQDNFFEAGGHSLLAVRVISRIAKSTGVRVGPSALALQTLAQVAAECERRATVPPARTPSGSVIAVSPAPA